MLLTFLNNYWMKKYYRVLKSFTDILNGFSYNGNCSNGNRNFDLVFNYIIVMLTADKLSMLKKCLYTSFVNSIDFKSDYEDYGTPILHFDVRTTQVYTYYQNNVKQVKVSLSVDNTHIVVLSWQ